MSDILTREKKSRRETDSQKVAYRCGQEAP